MASPRSSQGPSISEKAPIPEPYNRSSRAVCKQLRHIHKACGQWPWDFLPGRIPESLDKHTLAPLVTAVEFACDDEHHVTLSELTEWLMGQKGDWVLTSTQSSNALEWVTYTHDKRANRRRSTHNGIDSGRQSSRTRKRQHSNDEVILPRPPRSDTQSRQKKRGTEIRSPTADNVAEVEAQSEISPEPEPDLKPEPEHEPQPEIELDPDMEMDVDDSNTNHDTDEKPNTNRNRTNNQTLEEAIAASARRLEEARNNLQEYEDHLQTEREDLKVIDALRSEASGSHEAAIQEWRDAVLQADTKQNELQQFQNLAQSFSRDTQAALEQHSQSLRQLSDQAIEVEKDAEDELRARRREFCILEDKKDTKEGIIKKISARIRRYQDDIDAEEVKHQRLLAEHYLELLSNEIIQGISIADISYAKILEIKLERDQRIWYERRQMD